MTVHVKPAPQKSLGMSEWQVEGIVQALAEAEKPGAFFVDHDEVLAKWEAKQRSALNALRSAFLDLDEIVPVS